MRLDSGVQAMFGPFASLDEAIAAGRDRDPAVHWTPEREGVVPRRPDYP